MELRPGLFWARTQLPFKPGHVNVWLLADPDGWTVVDPGYDTPDNREAFRSLLASLGEPPIARVLVTHAHVDHCSIAGWLCEEEGARLAISRTEWGATRIAGTPDEIEHHVDTYRSADCPPEWLDEIAAYRRWFAENFAGLPFRYERLAEGQTYDIGGRKWEVLAGGGHAPEQVMLLDRGEGILIAADHLLPTINPSVMFRTEEPWSDPLADALHSLSRWRGLPPATEIYPAHGDPCIGIGPIIDRAMAHYLGRLEKVRAMLPVGTTAYQVMEHLFGSEKPFAVGRIAVLECMALLTHLERQGEARSSLDADGVRRFAAN